MCSPRSVQKIDHKHHKISEFGLQRTAPQFCCVAPTFCSASLTALQKIKGGVLPIAVGEVFRRLIAKCIAQEASSEVVELFSSTQLGVAFKCGAESIVHATKQNFQNLLNNEKGGLLQIDFKKAFNSNTRSGVLDAAQKFIPSLAPFCFFLLFSA